MSSLYRISLIWQARPEVHKSSHPAVWNTHELTPISSSRTIRLPHILAAKGQTHSCHKDFQVLAPVNSSSALSSRITSGGDKTLPGRSSGHSPWRHKILSAVVFTCAALTLTRTHLFVRFALAKERWNGSQNQKVKIQASHYMWIPFGTVRSQLNWLIYSILSAEKKTPNVLLGD